MKKILWIDDDEELIDCSIQLFLQNGFEIVKATNISRALKILRQDKVDGILLDVHLRGDEDGLELLAELKYHYSEIKVVIFTAFPDYGDHVRAILSGANIYLEKVNKQIPLDSVKQKGFFEALDKIFSSLDNQELKSKEVIESTRDKTEIQDHRYHLQRLLKISIRRLRELEVRTALQGNSTPPEVIIEIEDLTSEIERLKKELGL